MSLDSMGLLFEFLVRYFRGIFIAIPLAFAIYADAKVQ